MGHVLDFVPNHVGIADSRNEWWMDVLENGPSSRFAPYFDIDWEPLTFICATRFCCQFSATNTDACWNAANCRRFEEGTFYLLYGERRLPIAPGTYRYILEIALQNLSEYRDEDIYAEVQSILTALEYLPKRTETDPKRIAEREREKEIIKRRLERRCAEAPEVQRAIEKALLTD
jgi:Maltooligosyl trehalose synthase